MKSILISIKPKWCASIMNGNKSIEVRKNKALANAIQKLINENGYADIYVYCSKDGYNHLHKLYDHSTVETLGYSMAYYKTENVRRWDTEPASLNGKVVFKFRCYKVEEILNYGLSRRSEIMMEGLLKKSCITMKELNKYAPDKEYDDNDYIYAIHISDLEIFDKPKELSEFWTLGKHCKHKNKLDKDRYCDYCYNYDCMGNNLTKAPQNFCYVEGE